MLFLVNKLDYVSALETPLDQSDCRTVNITIKHANGIITIVLSSFSFCLAKQK